MWGHQNIRGLVVRKRVEQISQGARRGTSLLRRFVPGLGELETRQLLSQLVVTSNADSGPGTLRAEVGAATAGDLITFARSLRGQTVALASPIAISASLTIRGFAGGPTISGSGTTGIFTVSSGVLAKLMTLKLENGYAARGGAIDNSGTLVINTCVLTNNEAAGGTTAAQGGAIYNGISASLTIINSRLTGNRAIDRGTASGGAVENAALGVLSVRGSTFAFNQAISNSGSSARAAGGAIDSLSATVAISNSRFNGNIVSGYGFVEGGAINNSEGVFTVARSIFTNNQALAAATGGSAEGGAVADIGAGPGSTTLTVSSSSFARNRAVAAAGGDGVTAMSSAYGGAMGSSGTDVIVNVSTSSFIGNQAIAAMPSSTSTGNLLAGIAVGGAIENDTGATFTLRTSFVTGNRAVGGSSGANGSGGAAFGGGIGDWMGTATLNVTNTTVTGNAAQGGGGMFGAGEGGGIAVFENGRATLSGVSMAGNRAAGAPGADGTLGSLAGGGGLLVGLGFGTGSPGLTFPDGSTVSITRSSVVGNSALGGTGITGGDAQGGGIDLAAGSLVVQTTFFSGNVARGGTGSTGGTSGDGDGGGCFAANGTSLQFMRSSLIGNVAAGGSTFMGASAGAGTGGGLYIQPSAIVTLDSATMVFANSATTQSNQIYGPYSRS